jgi:ubiquinone biosynthesis protein COQ9
MKNALIMRVGSLKVGKGGLMRSKNFDVAPIIVRRKGVNLVVIRVNPAKNQTPNVRSKFAECTSTKVPPRRHSGV